MMACGGEGIVAALPEVRYHTDTIPAAVSTRLGQRDGTHASPDDQRVLDTFSRQRSSTQSISADACAEFAKTPPRQSQPKRRRREIKNEPSQVLR